MLLGMAPLNGNGPAMTSFLDVKARIPSTPLSLASLLLLWFPLVLLIFAPLLPLRLLRLPFLVALFLLPGLSMDECKHLLEMLVWKCTLTTVPATT